MMVKKQQLCVYCGIKPTKTRDHIISKTLFTYPYPNNLWTVKSCEECNQKKSRNEGYLRDIIAFDVNNYGNPNAEKLKPEAFRSAHNPKYPSRLSNAARTGTKFVPVQTQAGIHFGNYPEVPIEKERVNEVLKMMVQGLTYKVLNRRIELIAIFDFKRLDPSKLHLLQGDGFSQPLTLGGYSFMHKEFKDPTTNEDYIFWVLNFLDGVVYLVSVNNKP